MKKDRISAMETGNRIRIARTERKYTIEQLAELADMSPQYISEVELGKKCIGSEKLKSVCLALNKSADFFLFGYENLDAQQANLLETLFALPPVLRNFFFFMLEHMRNAPDLEKLGS